MAILPPVLITVPAASLGTIREELNSNEHPATSEEPETKDSAMLVALDAVTEFLYRVFIK